MNQLKQLPSILALSELARGQGQNRAPIEQCHIQASDDIAAGQCWLAEHQHSPSTQRAYEKEWMRLVLFAHTQLNKSLSDLNRDDLRQFFYFLQDPQPRHLWCSVHQGQLARQKKGWRPFKGPLSGASLKMSYAAIRSLFNFLVNVGYLKLNPLQTLKLKNMLQPSAGIELAQQKNQTMQVLQRILYQDEWAMLLKALEEMPETTEQLVAHKVRLRFVMQLLYLTGLRIGESVRLNWSDFKQVDGMWWLFVVGKGQKAARIPVNRSLLRAMMTYRRHLQLDLYPDEQENTPVIRDLNGRQGVTAETIRTMLKQLGQRAASFCDVGSQAYQKLQAFSPHWLRHLSASHQNQLGIPFSYVKENLRHQFDETTRLYVHEVDVARHQALEALKFPEQVRDES